MGLLLRFHAQDGLTPRPILVLQFLRDASILEYVQCKSVYGRPLGIRQPERQSFLTVALLIIAGQYLIVTFGGEMFSVVPLSWKDWGTIIGSTSLVLWIGEIGRLIEDGENK